MQLIREQIEYRSIPYKTQTELDKIFKRQRGHRGRGSSLSSRSRRLELGKNSKFNPCTEDNMASSHNPPAGYQYDLLVIPYIPPLSIYWYNSMC